MSERSRRREQNEELARDVNEALERRQHESPGQRVRFFVCECAQPSCAAPIPVRPSEFERIRSHPRRFFVLPGHEDGEIECVVETHPDCTVVEKYGEAGEIAEAG
jgi:hypothetical protein